MKANGTILYSIFVKRLGVDFSKVKTIVDLGAWIGITPCWFAQKNLNAIVIAVEPIIENYVELIKKIIKENTPNVIPVLTAISDKTGKGEIFLAEKSNAHSFFIKKRFIDGKYKRLVPTITWDDLMDSLNIKEVDVAKVNIEGSEIDLFKGMTKVFPKKMVIDEHSRCLKDETFYSELVKLIKEKGYKILEFDLPGCKKSDLYLVYGKII